MKIENSFLRFGDVAKFRNGLNFTKESRGSGCPLIGIPDFQNRFTPNYDSLEEIDPSGLASEEDYLQKHDIIFVRSNGNKALVGRSLYLDRDIRALFSGFCIRARIFADELDPKFCAYFTRSKHFKKSISSSAGTNINNLNQDILGDVAIPRIDKDRQLAIAELLGSLDAKVELNNRINEELEGLAKLLYDYWFVQFDFPITAAQAAAMGKPKLEDKPYRASGGKMIFNEALKREIPEGWRHSTIGETFKTHLGGTPSRENEEYWTPAQVNWLSSGENPSTFVVAPDEQISKLGLQNSPARLLPVGTVILSIVRHLRASILGIEAATNQSVVGIVETKTFKHCFIYPYLVREIPRLMVLRTGAQQPHINKGVLDASFLVVPDESTLEAYTSLAAPLFLQIKNHHQQNRELTELRDWLLPMLMNGQVTVG